jgi:YD repeat-containing protein
VLCGALVAAGVPTIASASPETAAYLGAQQRHTLDEQALADRARLAVNVANGNLVVTFDDVRIKGRGLDLLLSRTYNGRSNRNGQFGHNWTSSFGSDNGLGGLPSQSLTWTGQTGETYLFTKQPNGTYTSPPGVNAKLEDLSDGDARLTFNRSGTKLEFEADTSVSKRLSKAVDRNGNEITLGPSSLPTSLTDTQGRQITFTYSTSMVSTITDPTGRQWQYGYTGSNLTSYTDLEGKLWTYHYDASNQLDRITDPRGNDTLIGYDTTDRVTSVTRKVDGTTANDVTTTYSYPAVTSPCTSPTHAFKTVVTNPRGKTTTYCADNDRQVLRARNALNQDTTSSYTPNGDISMFTELAGSGQPPQVTLAHNATTNNLTGGTMGGGESFARKYCGDAGEPTCASLGFATAPYVPTRSVDAEGADTLFGYDSRGNLTDVKDAPTPRNKATLTYNPDGTLATATDGRGNQATFSYFSTPANQAGNLRTLTPPATTNPGAALGSTLFTYDTLSRIRTVTDGRGVVTTYAYDTIDRVKSIATSGGGLSLAFTYDGNGNLTQRVASDTGTTTYGYDKLNRRTSELFPGTANGYGYDKRSNSRRSQTRRAPSPTRTTTSTVRPRSSRPTRPGRAPTRSPIRTTTTRRPPTQHARSLRRIREVRRSEWTETALGALRRSSSRTAGAR